MDADWPLIGVRFALYATLSGLFGLSAFSLYGLKAGERADALALRPWLVGTGLLGLLFSGIALVLLAAAMAGRRHGRSIGKRSGCCLPGPRRARRGKRAWSR